MLNARTTCNAHAVYVKFRSALELLEALNEDETVRSKTEVNHRKWLVSITTNDKFLILYELSESTLFHSFLCKADYHAKVGLSKNNTQETMVQIIRKKLSSSTEAPKTDSSPNWIKDQLRAQKNEIEELKRYRKAHKNEIEELKEQIRKLSKN